MLAALGFSVGGGHGAEGPECGEARQACAGKAHERALERSQPQVYAGERRR